MTATQPLLQELHTRLSSRAEDVKRTFTDPLTLHNEAGIPPEAVNAHDLVISHFGATFTDNPPDYLLRAGRCLKPDGLLLASMLGAESFIELRQLKDVPAFTPLPDIRDVGAALQQYKFALPVIDKDVLLLTFSTSEKLIEMLEACNFAPLIGGTDWLKSADLSPLKREDGLYAFTLEIIYAHGWFPADNQPQPLKPGSATVNLEEILSQN